MTRQIFGLILVPVLAISGSSVRGQEAASQAGPPRQPVYISLFSTIDNHLNPDLSDECLRHTMDLVGRYRQQFPASRLSCLLLFSGTTSDALEARDKANGLSTRVRQAARQGVVEIGYDGAQEPTFLARPRPNFRRAKSGEQRWLARSEAAEWFLTEYKDAVTGEPDPERSGGLRRTLEVFGTLASVGGVSLELGSDSEMVHQVRRWTKPTIMPGVPENTDYVASRLHGFRGSSAAVGKAMSPEPTTSPELFWMDGVLRLSDTSGAPVKVVAANQGMEALKQVLDGLDRSRPHVIRLWLAPASMHMRPGFANNRYVTPLEWAYDNPKAAHFGPEGRTSQADVDAAYAREDATVRWLVERYFPDNPGSRFVSVADLGRAAKTSVGTEVPLTIARAAASDLLARWNEVGNYAPDSARAGGECLSLADMFQALATALGERQRYGAWPQSVGLQRVYGPLELTEDGGPTQGSVQSSAVLEAAAGLVARLNARTWKPVPENVIPTWVDVGSVRVNAAQFLRLMAETISLVDVDRPLPLRMSYMFSPVGEGFPKSRRRTDVGGLWTLKPAPLKFSD
jgi:hypothetical protein